MVAILVAATLAVSACSESGASAGSSAESPPGSSGGGRIDWHACDPNPDLDCADVPVPVDWSNPDGDRLTLAVIRHRASKPDQRLGTILANPGGPGDTGVGLVRSGGDDIDKWGDGRFDIVSWDPRGTHGSSPVHCFTSDEQEAAFWQGAAIPSTPAESAAFAQRTTDLAQRCGAVMGDLLSHISTEDTVRDLDHLRELVGDDRITYVGLSYGTMIGQLYANLYPDRVRAMLLDGIVDPVAFTTSAEAMTTVNSSSTDAVFAQFLELCDRAGPATCALAGHGQTAADRVAGLFDRAEQGPIPAPNSPAGVLMYSDLQVSSFSPLRDPHTWTDYARQLEAAIEGDGSALATTAYAWREPKAWAESTKSAAISCLDGPAARPIADWPTVIGDLTAASAMSGAIQGWWLWAPCASNWPGRSDDRYTGPWDAETDNPILLIGTRYDPNTGYANAVRSEKLLGNAVLLTHDGYGHVSYKDPSACIDQWRPRYLVDLETPAPGTVCAADEQPFHYSS
jgi:pimeloyl-ACP methyl ester carboxylesterase